MPWKARKTTRPPALPPPKGPGNADQNPTNSTGSTDSTPAAEDVAILQAVQLKDVLSAEEVGVLLGFGRTWVYNQKKSPDFPKPAKLAGERADDRWFKRDIAQWLERQRLAANDEQADVRERA